MAPNTPTKVSTPGKVFKTGDLVFAKLRGYPAWPARVENVAVSSPSPKNSKYNIFFFGTYQTAKCAGDQMWNYKETCEKFGKPNKSKGFEEAMNEIQNNPFLVVSKGSSSSESAKKPDKTQSPSKTTQSTSKDKKKRSISEVDASTGSAGTGEAKTPTVKVQARDANDEDDDEKSPPPKKVSKVKSPSVKSPLTVVYPALKSPRKEKTATSESRVQKLNHKKETATSDTDLKDIKNLTAVKPEGEVQVQLTRQQILHLLSLDNLPDSLRAKLEQHTMEKFVAAAETQEIREKQEFLRTELQLMMASRELDKIFTGDEPPDLERGLRILDELYSMPVNCLMLKKQPKAVELVAKLRRYTGCIKQWNLTLREQEIFHNDVKVLREKSAQTLNRFVHMCNVPPHVRGFLNWFQEQAKHLRINVSGQNFVLMTQEPILVDLESSSDDGDNERMEPSAVKMAKEMKGSAA